MLVAFKGFCDMVGRNSSECFILCYVSLPRCGNDVLVNLSYVHSALH